ncbi:MAG: NAD(P)/FAD-dependent oxidoreductase [Vulcanimicrobiaceae bacterium]
MDADIAIVGSGIIGTTATLALQDAGLRTITFDPVQVGAWTAEGSAGFLHDGEIFPLPHPRLLTAVPRMLLDPLGPLVFRSSYIPQLTGWSAQFLRAMRKERYEIGIAALSQLNKTSVDTLVDMARAAGADDLIVRNGGLKACRDARTLDGLSRNLHYFEDAGIPAEMLDARALAALEPALSDRLAGGMYFPHSAHCVDLAEFGRRLGARVRERGNVVLAAADRIVPEESGAWAVTYGRRERVVVGRVLVAAGHASAKLLRPLGYRVPLAPARGYHLMLANPGVQLQRAVIVEEAHFGVTPMRAGLRLAGTMEFAPADTPPDMRRAENLYKLALPYLPGLERANATAWMGVRPVSADDVPMIGRAGRHANLYYSFGHGHLGLTQSATSARAIAALVTGETPPFDLRPFDLARFA